MLKITLSIPFQKTEQSEEQRRQQRVEIYSLLLIGLLVTRGLFELFLPKSLAMLFHLVGVTGLIAYLFSLDPQPLHKRQGAFLFLLLLFSIEAMVSGLLTSALQDFHGWLIYTFFNIGILWIGFKTQPNFSTHLLSVPLQKIILWIGWGLLLISLFEQAGYVHLKGATPSYIPKLPARPASLTGSYLHFPLVMALFSYIILQWAILSKQKIYFFSGLCFALSPILAFSRSGAFIVLFTALLFFIHSCIKGKIKVIICGVGVITLFIAAAFYAKDNTTSSSIGWKLLTRIIKAGDTKAQGNQGRIFTWKKEINHWWDTHLLLGEQTGLITNSAHIKSNKKDNQHGVRIAESGVLQQLANFGLIGLLIYYTMLIWIYLYIQKGHLLLRFVYISSLIQTLFYQSIESVSFMVLLFLMPWLSQAMATQTKLRG